MTFYEGVRVLGTVPVSNGQAVLTTILLGVGGHFLHAYLRAPPPYAPSASAALQRTVNPVVANAFRAAVIDTSPIAAGSLVAVADFNGDGRADIVTTTGVAVGNGDGTFRALIPTSSAASATGDFNGDGRTDLATSAGILLGNGDGTFQAPIGYPAGTAALRVVADFNDDGNADLATDTGFLLGNGDGTFQPEKAIRPRRLSKVLR